VKLLLSFTLLISAMIADAFDTGETVNTKKTGEHKPAERIIALSPHAVEMLFAIGAGDRIVGTVEYADYPEAALKIPRIGNYTGIQLEQVVAMEPDLIVAWKSGNKITDLKKLESLGFNMFYTQPKNIPQIGKDIQRLGELTGLQNKAHKVTQALNQSYQAIKNKYKDTAKVDVFYQLWHDPLRTVGPGSWIQTMITDCNGNNVFNDTNSDYPAVSMESVLVKNPQVIIIPHHSGEVGAKRGIWKQWSMVQAVKHNRLFTLSGDILHRFAPRAVEGLSQLCEAIDSAR
jgi:ABC-type Fe3+-hydroxamate transport system substrate-binding protein